MPLVSTWELLIEYLRLADVARLHEALCVRDDYDVAIAHQLWTRIGLVRRLREPSLQWVFRYVAASSHRCRECGSQTARSCRVCKSCADAEDSFFALRDRKYARARRPPGMRSRRMEQLLSELFPVTKTAYGAYLHWKADLDELVRSSNPHHYVCRGR